MGKKKKEQAQILSQEMLSAGIYDMWLTTSLAGDAKAGQFIGVYSENGAQLLPRPISICEVNEEKTALRIVYRVAGSGTAEFAMWKQGKRVELLGVLGNGFPVNAAIEKRVVLLGGGIGIPPMLELAKELNNVGVKPMIIVGYRDRQVFLKKDLEKYGQVLIATEDGSVGIKGNVLTVMKNEQISTDMLMACGPMPMLRAIKAYAQSQKLTAYISLEERMACGVGACLGCVCRTKNKDAHSHVNNARICTDGPVFDAQEVDI